MIHSLFQLLRVPHYIKNTFIYAPLFFALQAFNISLLIDTSIAFLAFCLCASAVYIFNDYHDITSDQLHPEKKHRPLASGAINKQQAIFMILGLLVLSFTCMLAISLEASALLLCYCLINIAYSLGLKQILGLDVSIIALGFVLRLFVGSFASQIPLSYWIISLTFLLAIFLGLAKRRNELIIFHETGKEIRNGIGSYKLKLLDAFIYLASLLIIICYIFYTISTHKEIHGIYLYATSIFVSLGIFRYLKITVLDNNSGFPTQVLYSDRWLQLSIVSWIISFVCILYI